MKKIFFLIVIALTAQSIKAQADAFITTWVTTTGFETLTLAALTDAPNYTINWGDGSATNTYAANQNPSHLYINSGEYTVSFTGTFPQLNFREQTKLKAVQQWGTQKWTSMANMFDTCYYFNSLPTQAPDLSLCTNMSYMFTGAIAFNQPIGSWDVSNVTNMSHMFRDATAFNQPIGSWNVSKVTNMSWMFVGANTFNQPIGSWNVSNVTNMSYMFGGAKAFNQPIGSWNVSQVTDMAVMFSGAKAFNQPIGTWNVSNVKHMSGMFYDAIGFNQPLGSWDVSQVTDMAVMFAVDYQDLSNVNSFNQPIGSWNVSQVTDMQDMFSGGIFNQPIGAWDVSQVTNMYSMFSSATAFNQPIGSWNVSKVTDMSYMFINAKAFNQTIGSWDVSQVTTMQGMFARATAFNQDIGSWNVSKVTNMSSMFYNAKLSTVNYDAALIGWATRGANGGILKTNVTFSGGNSTYCNGSDARNLLINTYGWNITDAGVNCNSLGTEAFDKSSLSLYPNPTLSVLNIKTNENLANQTYAIIDALGKIVLKGKLNEGNNTINVEQLSKGIYYLKVANDKASKFIKE